MYVKYIKMLNILIQKSKCITTFEVWVCAVLVVEQN